MSSLSARTAPFQVAFMRILPCAAAAARACKGRSFAGRAGDDASGLPAPGMLYRGGNSALTSARDAVSPLERSVLAEPAGRPGNAGRDLRRVDQAAPWVAVRELLRQRQVRPELALAVHLDAR